MPKNKRQAVDIMQFRQCLSKFTTGVTVITCSDPEGGKYGMTVNSFSSVSLEPPLILWNIAKDSDSLQAFLDAKLFAINILAAGQKQESSYFAKSENNIFDGIDHLLSDEGVPLLKDTLACLECCTYQIHESGDHYIVVGEVTAFRSEEVEPLVFYDGGYESLKLDK